MKLKGACQHLWESKYQKFFNFQHWNITGLEKLVALSGQSGVIVANHQYSLDLFALFVLWPICRKMTVVSKSSLKYTGPFGIVALKCGIIFIDRKKRKESHEIVQVCDLGPGVDFINCFASYAYLLRLAPNFCASKNLSKGLSVERKYLGAEGKSVYKINHMG